jgi:uncharacterized protein
MLRSWILGSFELLISAHIQNEVEHTLSKPYFLTQVEPDVHRSILDALRAKATRVTITSPVSGVASHPEDDLVLATAVSAAADYLVTGDKQLRRLGAFQGVPIVSPGEFLARIDR